MSNGKSRIPWPVVRQVLTGDIKGLADTAKSDRSRELAPRIRTADRVVESVCPY